MQGMGPRQHLCAKFHKAVELIGGRWTGAVIRLLLNDRMRFAELRGAIPDISDRMLSERLRELETEGIVARIVVPETPVRVEYELSKKGRALRPAIDAIADWSHTWVGAAAGGTGAGAGAVSRAGKRVSLSTVATAGEGLTTGKAPSMRTSSLRKRRSTAMPAELTKLSSEQSSRMR